MSSRNLYCACPTCGLEFRQGRGFHKHVQTCVVPHDDSYHHGMPTSDDDGSVHADGDALPPAPDPSGCNQDDSDDDFADNSIETHLQKLDDAGTLCNEHVLQYARWGKVYLTPEESEIFRFLRSVESGGGASDGSAQSSLKYARTLGERGSLLPATVKTCWKTVTKVRFHGP